MRSPVVVYGVVVPAVVVVDGYIVVVSTSFSHALIETCIFIGRYELLRVTVTTTDFTKGMPGNCTSSVGSAS